MLQNTRVVAFTVLEFLGKTNREGGGGGEGVKLSPATLHTPPTQIE